MTWYPGAVGTWWLSGTPGYEVSVEQTHLGLQIVVMSLRGRSYGSDMVRLSLNHQAFTLPDAQARAEALVLSLPTLDDAPIVHPHVWPDGPTVIRAGAQKVIVPGGPVRCAQHHAWSLDAEDRDVCQCGRLTFGFARGPAKRTA